MPKLVWDKPGEHFYETGVNEVALYIADSEGAYPKGVAWNGITAVNESPSGAETTSLYANNNKYLNLLSKEEYACTIEAYTYPDEFAQCDGSATLVTGAKIGQQARKSFGLAFKTQIGNDTDNADHGYTIHLVYGLTASPSAKNHSTINESPEAVTMSWEAKSIPVPVTGFKATSTVEIKSTDFKTPELKAKLVALEEALYGKDGEDAYLPLPDEVKTLLS